MIERERVCEREAERERWKAPARFVFPRQEP